MGQYVPTYTEYIIMYCVCLFRCLYFYICVHNQVLSVLNSMYKFTHFLKESTSFPDRFMHNIYTEMLLKSSQSKEAFRLFMV